MNRLRYLASVSNEVVELDGPASYVGIAAGVRSNSWDYSLEGRAVSSRRRLAREEDVEITTTREEAERISAIFDSDFAAEKPGILECEGWTQRCFILTNKPSSLGRGGMRLAATVLLLDGVWKSGVTYHMFQASGDSQGTKIYDYEYPYEYASEYAIRNINISSGSPMTFKFVFFGPAVNPQVRIGKNVYKFTTAIPAGGHMIVDTSAASPKVNLVSAEGLIADVFSCAERGTGEGCGTYAFERVAPGVNEVWWSDMFGFDLTVYKERGDLPYALGGSKF